MENQKYKKSGIKLTAEQKIRELRKDQENNGIGKRIKKLRTEQQLTGAELASMVDMKQSRISEIENGKRNLDSSELPLFAAALNTTVDYLCSGHSPETVNVSLLTGLDETALDTLKWYKSSGNNGFSMLLNFLLSSAVHDKNIEFYQETIGQDLLQEMQEYIFFGNDLLFDMEIGSDKNGKPIKKKITVKDTSIFRIKTCLDYLNEIYFRQKHGRKTGK